MVLHDSARKNATFAAHLEDLLEDWTTRIPDSKVEHMVMHEFYQCNICLQEAEDEAVAIKHEDWCTAGKLQEMLLR